MKNSSTAVEGFLAALERPPLGYILAGLPEVARVGQPPVQLGQSLQHFGQQGEGHPVFSSLRPAGRQDLLLHRQKEYVMETQSMLFPL